MPVRKVTKIPIDGQQKPLYKFEDFQPLSVGDYSQIYDIETNIYSTGIISEPPAERVSNLAKSNIFYTNENEKELNITVVDGPVYLFDITGFAYFHSLYDKLLQYYFIKRYVPGIKFVPVSYTNRGLDNGNKVLNDFLSLHGFSFDDTLNMHRGNYIFKEVYNFIFEHNEFMMPLKENIKKREGFDGWSDPVSYTNYLKIGYEELKCVVKDSLKKSDNRKLFISRRSINNANRSGQNWNQNYFYENRLISLKDELKLEDFFKSLGYEIVFAEDYTFLEQVSMYSEATHVASLKSSGLCNMMFCNPGTQIISINVDDSFECWYETMAKAYDLNYIEIPRLKGEGAGTLHQMTIFPQNGTDYSIEYILDLLKGPHRFTVGMI